MTDIGTNTLIMQIVTAVLSLIATCFTGGMAYLVAKLNWDQKLRAERAAVEVGIVKDVAVEAATKVEGVAIEAAKNATIQQGKLDSIARSSEDIRTYVNHERGQMLEERVADKKALHEMHPTKETAAAVQLATDRYDSHMRAQVAIDGAKTER